LIKKVSEKTQNDKLLGIIQESYSSKKDFNEEEAINASKASLIRLCFELLNTLIDVLDEDVSVWFADLLNVSMEDYDKLPLSIEAEVIQQILESDEVTDFFSFASQTFNSIQRFKTQPKSGKTK